MEKEKRSQVKESTKKITNFINHHYFLLAVIIIAVTLIIGLVIYVNISSSRVYIEKAEIYTPIITLTSQNTGILDRVFVKEGDSVGINTVVAEVDGKPIKAKTAGLITYVQNAPGVLANPSTPIVKMIDPSQFKLIGHVVEDKGLDKLKPGQTVQFKVDAFGNKKYYGTVESVSPSARQSDIVFSISDKRQEKEFDVYIKFDTSKYSELKNGMSAKLWVYVK